MSGRAVNADIVELPDDDLVECLFCEAQIDPYFARCTDSGWVCDDCMENMA